MNVADEMSLVNENDTRNAEAPEVDSVSERFRQLLPAPRPIPIPIRMAPCFFSSFIAIPLLPGQILTRGAGS
jgi:hypothetical protein